MSSSNDLIRLLIGPPVPQARRNMGRLALVVGGLAITVAVLCIVFDAAEFTLALICPFGLAVLIFPVFIANDINRRASKVIGTEKYDLIRLTERSPREIIESFFIAMLYRRRRMVVALYAATPGVLVAAMTLYVAWIISPHTLRYHEALIAISSPLVWLRLLVFFGAIASTAAQTLTMATLQMWGLMAKSRAEFKTIAADLLLALSLWALTLLQWAVPILAIINRRTSTNEPLRIIILTLLALLPPVGFWLLSLWMLRMADTRL